MAGAEKATSPYEELYRSRKDFILWGSKPGRLVNQIEHHLGSGRVLDAGCGDGKNALALEQRGYEVHGVDSSRLALKGLNNRFAAARWRARGRYELLDVRNLNVDTPVDILVSYGLFHCLPVDERIGIHRRLQQGVRCGGFMLFSCLTSEFPMPVDHGTGGMVLAEQSEITALVDGWHIEHFEAGAFEEEHLPIVGFHKHSAAWVIARRK